MERTNIKKNSLIMSYHFGKDIHGNPKTVSQKFSNLRLDLSNEDVKKAGLAFATLIDSEQVIVNKEELLEL
ncbi:MAG: DUF1659 domain-containing protein [Sarcina sp.]